MTDSFQELLSADARHFKPSEIRAFAKLINDPSIISFAGGVPNPATFPAEMLAGIAARVIRERPAVALQYGPTAGLPRLRALLAGITRERQIECVIDEVMLTSGSQQALSLISHALLDPGDVVLVELPTYIGASSCFVARRGEMVGVEQDDEGVVPEALRKTALRLQGEGRCVKFFYTIPNFQNPSGRLMSLERRMQVLEIASELDFLILEDDPYGELVYAASAAIRPIKSWDERGRVIYLSTFSKTLSPALRCGWIACEEGLRQTFELAKEAADLCSGMLDQAIIEEFCLSGELPAQIARVCVFYRERRATLMAALDEHFAGRARWTEALGGLFTFVTLDALIDTASLVPKAIERGVAFIPGGPFFVDGSGRNTMRLTFAKEPDERIREGIARLARLFFQEKE